MAEKYDVVILATEKDLPILKKAVPYYKKNLNPQGIYIVTSKKNEKDIGLLNGVNFVDESNVYEGLSYDACSSVLLDICHENKRAGWYLQQFIKLAWAYRTEDENYVVIDADTIPLHKIEFINQNGQYLFTGKKEYNKPYFDTLSKLFNGSVKRAGDFSFVAEHMMFCSKFVREMLDRISCDGTLDGTFFWEKILRSIDKNEILKSGFSEFETYGNYMMFFHPESMQIRKLRTLRESMFVLGGSPTDEQLQWAAKDFDIVSIEDPEYQGFFSRICRLKLIRNAVSFRNVTRFRMGMRAIYRRLTKKKDVVYDDI